MINTTFKLYKIEKENIFPNSRAPEDIQTPIQRVKNFLPEQFENFILEWANTKKNYLQAYTLGGSGDGGIDILCEIGNNKYDYFQCKRYSTALTPSVFWIEVGKICYNIFIKKISMPENYFIVATNGVGPTLDRMFRNPDLLKNELIKNWDKYCKSKIVNRQNILLVNELKEFIDNFDFSIFKQYSINLVIEEYRKTEYFYFRFGGILKPKRKQLIKYSRASLQKIEMNYTKKLIKVLSDYNNVKISVFSQLSKYPKINDKFQEHREYFYSAESLKRDIIEIFNDDEEFSILMNEMYEGIKEIGERDCSNYEKLNNVLHESTKVILNYSYIDTNLRWVNIKDRKGMCHHLANEDRIEWE